MLATPIHIDIDEIEKIHSYVEGNGIYQVFDVNDTHKPDLDA